MDEARYNALYQTLTETIEAMEYLKDHGVVSIDDDTYGIWARNLGVDEIIRTAEIVRADLEAQQN